MLSFLTSPTCLCTHFHEPGSRFRRRPRHRHPGCQRPRWRRRSAPRRPCGTRGKLRQLRRRPGRPLLPAVRPARPRAPLPAAPGRGAAAWPAALRCQAWRTLPLLVIQPGRLTRNYIEGKRIRYVSPLALFLFMVFLMFFVVSSLTHVGGHGDSKGNSPPQGTIKEDVSAARKKLAAAEATLAGAKAAGQDSTAAEQDVERARDAVDDAETAMAMVAGSGDSMEKVIKKVSEKNVNFNTGSSKIDAAARFAAANPTFTLYKLKNAASQYSFMLVPISLPFLWLMFFWKRGVTMFDHAVFALYGLSFMALLVVVGSLSAAAGLSAVAGLLFCLAPPIHMFLQLKGAYQLRTFSALWRTVVLLFVSVMVLSLYLLLILAISLGT